MKIEELRRVALEQARGFTERGGDAADRLRAEARELVRRVPEPPLYRRRVDPARAQAEALLAELEPLLARAYALEAEHPAVAEWRGVLDAHAEALCLVSEGRVEAASDAWTRAVTLERRATAATRLWARGGEARVPVFDRLSRASRYDPRAEALLEVRLPCPSCRQVARHAVSLQHASHPVHCASCGARFRAYVAELRALEVSGRPGSRRYAFHLEEPSGAATRIEVQDAHADELRAAPRELLAFLYLPETVLRGVLNLDSSRVLWVSSGGPCFVATACLGEHDEAVGILRDFRERRLRPSLSGRAFIALYERAGPGLARAVARRPRVRAVLGPLLAALAHAIQRRCV